MTDRNAEATQLIHNRLDVLDIEWDGNAKEQDLLVLGWRDTAYAADEVPDSVWEELADPNIAKIVFTKADHHWLRKHGRAIEGPIVDVQTMCWTYDERTELSLDWCCKHYLERDPDKRIVVKQGKVMFKCDDDELVLIKDAPIDQLKRYNRRDLLATKDLAGEMAYRLTSVGQYEYWRQRHMPFSRVLLEMEMNGLPIDLEAAQTMHDNLEADQMVGEYNLIVDAKLPEMFNLGSRDQLAEYLFTDKFQLPARHRVTKEQMEQLREGKWPEWLPYNFSVTKLGRDYVYGDYELDGRGLKAKVKAPLCKEKKCKHEDGDCVPSVASRVLKVYHGDDEWVEQLIDYRVTSKVLQFISKWLEVQKGGRLHTHFNQTGTATGRLSSSDPINLQNVPSRGELGKQIRNLFVAPEGHIFVNGDYNQIEPRLMAHFSRDPVMTEAFEKGIDIYEQATVGVLGKRYPKGTPERQLVRTCFLAMGYGAQPPKVRANLAEEGFRFTLGEVKVAYEGIVDLYMVFWDWKEECIQEGRDQGFIETIAGHRRHLDFRGDAGWKSERQAVNSKIQGSAADIVQTTMVEAASAFPDWPMILQVHDEIMWCPRRGAVSGRKVAELQIIAERGHGFRLNVPLVFEPKVTRTWGEAK